jgi:hypothetical protein
MHRLMIAGLAAFLAIPSCVSTKSGSPRATTNAPAGASQAQPPAAVQKTDADSTSGGGLEQSAPATPPAKAAAAPPLANAAKSTDSRPVKKPGVPAPPAAPAAAKPLPASQPPKPTLDLASLEQRLRDTRAIGVFTKLSLKNQVDDLLGEFRALYQGPNKRPTAELRQRYDQLLEKVLGLLQDGDPELAATIASSREAIWGILADPEKFAKI